MLMLMRKRVLIALAGLGLLVGVAAGCGAWVPDMGPDATSDALVSPLVSTSSISPPATSQLTSWPSGRVAYHIDRGAAYNIHIVDQGVPRELSTLGLNNPVEPAWSPDGEWLAFVASTTDPYSTGIFVAQPDGSSQREVVPAEAFLNWRPTWSPDGDELVFQSNRDANFEIYKVGLDGSNITNLTNSPANDFDPDWSPDGTAIVFVSDRDTTSGIYSMAPDGSNVTPLLIGGGEYSYPRWSLDGRRIAFVEKRIGNLDLRVMDADGSNVQQVTNLPLDCTMPAWVANDRLLFSGESGDTVGQNWDLFLLDLGDLTVTRMTYTAESERFPSWVE